MRVETNLNKGQQSHGCSFGRLATRTVKVLTAFSVPIVAMVVLANLPKAEAIVLDYGPAINACIALCTASVTLATGGWAAVFGLFGCRAICLEAAKAI